MDDDSLWSDEDDDELIAAWAEVDRQAAQVLRTACAEVLREAPPQPELAEAAGSLRREIEASARHVRYFDVASGWAGSPPEDDVEVWLQALASTISPSEDTGAAAEEQAAIFSLQHADWLGSIVGLVRRGVGAEFDAEGWSLDLAALPEVDDQSEDPDDDLTAFSMPVELLAPLWQTLGVIDEDRCLTPLGRWGLPRALLSVWEETAAATQDRLDEEQVALALDILAAGPITIDSLRTELADRGVFAASDKIERSLIVRPEVYQLEEGRLVPFPALLDGSVLTHRVNAEEIESGVLDPKPDLVPFDYLAMDDIPFRGGGLVRSMHARQRGADGREALHGPPGWLAGLAAGDTLGLRYVDGEMSLDLTPVVDDADARTLLQATAWRCARQADEDEREFPGVDVTEIVLLSLIERPGLFDRPLAPISDLLADSGLEIDASQVGVPGTSWHGEPDWLTDAQRAAYRMWNEALAAHRDDELPEAAVLAALCDGLQGVVGDLAAYQVAAEPDREPLVVAMQEAVTGKALAVPLYLRARVAEVRGDVLAMSSLLEECLAADPDASDAAAELAELRAIAGDAAEAQRLFTLGGLERDAIEVRALRQFLSPPAGDIGRNKPCPCGSGRKYKLCHGRTAQHPLPDRANWLMVKVVGYLQRGHNRERLLHWAMLMSGEDRSSRETVTLAMHNPMTWDFALFDGGILEDFLAFYRPLLPPDEAQLAESWLDTDRRLLEVTEVTPMRGLTCRDLVTGESLALRDRTLTRSVQSKDLLLGRPLDYGEGLLQFWNDPVDIPRWLRPRLLRLLRSGAAPETLAAFFAPASRTPVLQTTEGEELVMCTARYEVPDPDAAWLALSRELDGDGEVLHQVVEVPGSQPLVRGTVRRARDRIVVETMSLERLRKLQALVLETVPDARLVDESTRPAADGFAETGPDMPPQDASAELAAEDIAALLRQHEDRWLSERIPALGGLTPREAAAEPAAREELIALLDDFEWQDRQTPNAFSMDVNRIRSELGLS